jgi:hypothetical protein
LAAAASFGAVAGSTESIRQSILNISMA